MIGPTATPASGRKIISYAAALGRTGFRARSTIWRRVRNCTFPAPVDMGGGRVGWYEDEIDAWLASRPRVSWAPQGDAA